MKRCESVSQSPASRAHSILRKVFLLLTLILYLALGLLVAVSVRASEVVFELSGTVTDTVSAASPAGPVPVVGDAIAAWVRFDSTTPDLEPATDEGVYDHAVVELGLVIDGQTIRVTPAASTLETRVAAAIAGFQMNAGGRDPSVAAPAPFVMASLSLDADFVDDALPQDPDDIGAGGLSVAFSGPSGANAITVDLVSVPEPGLAALLSTGIVGLALRAQRRPRMLRA